MRTRGPIALFSALVFLVFAAMGCGGGGSGDSGGNDFLPTASITADPESIQAGQSASISWSTDGGTVSISGIGSDLAANGSADVSPTATTTYTVTVVPSSGASATASVTVNVTPVTDPPPTAAIQASVASITQGQSAIISWQTSGGTVSIPGIGSNLPASGSQSATPAATTTYTVTVTAPDSQVATASVTVNVTPVTALWKVPANYNFYSVTTDGNLVVRTGYKVIAGNPPINLSAIVCYNSDGTTRWTKEFSYVDYSTSESVIANNSLYTLKVVGVFPPDWIIPASYDIYVDRFNLADGTAIGSSFFVGNTQNLASIATDSTGIFVSLNPLGQLPVVLKVDFSLSSKAVILTVPADVNEVPRNIFDITISNGNLGVAGIEYSADNLGYFESWAMVYTTAGNPVWANPQTYYPATGTFNYGNAVAFSGGYVYLTGYTMILPPSTGTYPPFLRKYNAANGSFVGAVSFMAEETANDLAFSPSGNIYVAISGAGSPVALDGNGNVLWTGISSYIDPCQSLVYFQGKIITTGSVYDAVTGQKLF